MQNGSWAANFNVVECCRPSVSLPMFIDSSFIFVFGSKIVWFFRVRVAPYRQLHYRQLSKAPLQALVLKAVYYMCWGNEVSLSSVCRKACRDCHWRQAAMSQPAWGLQQPHTRGASCLSLGSSSTPALNVFKLMITRVLWSWVRNRAQEACHSSVRRGLWHMAEPKNIFWT